MKILIVNTWYYPNLMGGAEHSVMLLAEGLAQNGHSVGVLTCDAKENDVIETINGVTVYRLSARKYDLFGAYFNKKMNICKKIINKYHELFNRSIQKNIEKLLDEISPDIVNVNCFSGLSYYLFQTIKDKKIPIVYTIRNFFIIYPTANPKLNIRLLHNVVEYIYKKITKKYLDNVDCVTAPSEFTIHNIEKSKYFNSVNKVVIPNCIDTKLDITKKEVMRRKKQISNCTKFLFAGWVNYDKGIMHLLEAFTLINRDDIELQVCGAGELEEIVTKYHEKYKYINFNGKLSKSELKKKYEECDVLIAPSLCEETFGRGLIEAASFGMPVICSNRGAMPEIISVLKNGLVYEAGNSLKLSSCIMKMTDKRTRLNYEKHILDNMLNYTLEAQVENYSYVYSSLLKGTYYEN